MSSTKASEMAVHAKWAREIEDMLKKDWTGSRRDRLHERHARYVTRSGELDKEARMVKKTCLERLEQWHEAGGAIKLRDARFEHVLAAAMELYCELLVNIATATTKKTSESKDELEHLMIEAYNKGCLHFLRKNSQKVHKLGKHDDDRVEKTTERLYEIMHFEGGLKKYVEGIVQKKLATLFKECNISEDVHNEDRCIVDVKTCGSFVEKLLFRHATLSDLIRCTYIVPNKKYMKVLDKVFTANERQATGEVKGGHLYMKNSMNYMEGKGLKGAEKTKRAKWPYIFLMEEINFVKKGTDDDYKRIFMEVQIIPSGAFKEKEKSHAKYEKQRATHALNVMGKFGWTEATAKKFMSKDADANGEHWNLGKLTYELEPETDSDFDSDDYD
mmetsp:Transcript_105877/g.188318  ORF Transcript_105877/g.188318 Transcript_105877/m.188318 type:complete len:387 (-) Transcript_105877:65-1225(-)